ncbi:hypothetical protein ALC53_04616 [Atta colombica]|uniref:Secreted protein n=1 Tax=Atta colombica TaxID=520822 RepID=A0A195BJM4_9HYME|nr:hypothetical protein ALC53_04616 [Atta colombica]
MKYTGWREKNLRVCCGTFIVVAATAAAAASRGDGDGERAGTRCDINDDVGGAVVSTNERDDKSNKSAASADKRGHGEKQGDIKTGSRTLAER